jgi:nicotinamide-nucleotide amidase
MTDRVPDDVQLAGEAEVLAALLLARGLTLATAESCTGGWIAKVLTEVPGSSAWFESGLVTYSDAAKRVLLDVPASTLDAHGAVSRECALAMVTGAQARFDVDLAVAVTGVAGPSGGSPDKPVGTVWIAWRMRDCEPEARKFLFDGDRDAVRRSSVAAALAGFTSLLAGVPAAS